MIIRYSKPKSADKSPTLTVIRDDGSTCWRAVTPFFVAHDLTHYAVETTLGYRNAFFGLLSQGWSLECFEQRDPGSRKARKVPDEAILAEVIVGCLDRQRGCPEFTDEHLLAHLRAYSVEHALPQIELPDGVLNLIRSTRRQLLQGYMLLSPGDSMDLLF